MDCPVCNEAMITLELWDVEIDHCLECKGIWLDAGELELLLDNGKSAQQLINSFHKDEHCTEKARKCPICYKKMEKILVGDDTHPLLIDRCIRGHGLWFDQGELREIIEKATLDQDNKIVNTLKEMFSAEIRHETNENQ